MITRCLDQGAGVKLVPLISVNFEWVWILLLSPVLRCVRSLARYGRVIE